MNAVTQKAVAAILKAKFDYTQTEEFISAVRKYFKQDDFSFGAVRNSFGLDAVRNSFGLDRMSGTFYISDEDKTMYATPFWDARYNNIPVALIDEDGAEIPLTNDSVDYDVTLDVEADAKKYVEVVSKYFSEISAV